MSAKGKIILVVLVLSLAILAGLTSFTFYDYTQNNPKFCVSCHLMQSAFDAWAESAHKDINCHDCHHLSIAEQNQLVISFVLENPERVPDRHGKVIVPWKYCIKCHWETDKKYPDAMKINTSNLHSKHYFKEKVECSRCHGYIVHKFTPEPRFCLTCHKDKVVHGTGMGELACLNCHTDRTPDLKPLRMKCLYCHGSGQQRAALISNATLDVRVYEPTLETINNAIKINVPKDAPMQFPCKECHHPHAKLRPDWHSCLKCHGRVTGGGVHKVHIKAMGMTCSNCHKPHTWRVTEEQARVECVMCHEYRSPEKFR